MLTREMIEERYNVQHDVIQAPGKYEDEPVETPYFHDHVLHGFQDGTIHLGADTVDYFEIREEDIKQFSRLNEYDYFFLQYSKDGFVYGEPMTETDVLDSPHEEIRILAQ